MAQKFSQRTYVHCSRERERGQFVDRGAAATLVINGQNSINYDDGLTPSPHINESSSPLGLRQMGYGYRQLISQIFLKNEKSAAK